MGKGTEKRRRGKKEGQWEKKERKGESGEDMCFTRLNIRAGHNYYTVTL